MKQKLKKYNNDQELLTLVIAGSVDDGKSTLIGRLLFDSGQIYEDQIASVEKLARVDGELDFSLFTDGLASEREQKITIDVAYRYFTTPKRHFIVADVPGHEQYIRNMITGASKADVALILIDARYGLLEQSKRHLFIVSLLGVSHVAIVINKMDLIDYSEEIFNEIKQQCLDFSGKLSIPDLQFIPASSLRGDMVVERGKSMSWYGGWTVLDYLENVVPSSSLNLVDFRLPVQLILRPNQDFRGYAGKIESGTISVGEKIKVLPSGKESLVKEIFVAGENREEAFSPQSVVVSLNDDLDVSRGDMITRVNNLPNTANFLEAMVCWFGENDFVSGTRYFLKHTTNSTSFFVEKILYAVDMNSLHRDIKDSLKTNEIGKVIIKTQKPLFFDLYVKNRSTGSFIIIDELTNNTVGAGIITGGIKGGDQDKKNGEIAEFNLNPGKIVWLTGLSGAGKTTIASRLIERLKEHNLKCEHLDGDIFRKELGVGLSYSEADRKTNIKIAAYVAKKLSEHGVCVIASFISPYRDQRDELKKENKNFFEVYIKASLETCIKRDAKGFYKAAQSGQIMDFTGISHPYEEPVNPDIEINTDDMNVEECVQAILNVLWPDFK